MNVRNTMGERTCIGVSYILGRGKICEEMPWLPGVSQFDPHPSIKPTEHDYSMALFTHGGLIW